MIDTNLSNFMYGIIQIYIETILENIIRNSVVSQLLKIVSSFKIEKTNINYYKPEDTVLLYYIIHQQKLNFDFNHSYRYSIKIYPINVADRS